MKQNNTLLIFLTVLFLIGMAYFAITSWRNKNKVSAQQTENEKLAQQARQAQTQVEIEKEKAQIEKDNQTISAKDLAQLIIDQLNKEKEIKISY